MCCAHVGLEARGVWCVEARLRELTDDDETLLSNCGVKLIIVLPMYFLK